MYIINLSVIRRDTIIIELS